MRGIQMPETKFHIFENPLFLPYMSKWLVIKDHKLLWSIAVPSSIDFEAPAHEINSMLSEGDSCLHKIHTRLNIVVFLTWTPTVNRVWPPPPPFQFLSWTKLLVFIILNTQSLWSLHQTDYILWNEPSPERQWPLINQDGCPSRLLPLLPDD
jgi:hypothetical protein